MSEATCLGIVPDNHGMAYVSVADHGDGSYSVDATPVVAWAVMRYENGSLYAEPVYEADIGAANVSGRLVWATPQSHPELNWYTSHGVIKEFNTPQLIKELLKEAKAKHFYQHVKKGKKK